MAFLGLSLLIAYLLSLYWGVGSISGGHGCKDPGTRHSRYPYSILERGVGEQDFMFNRMTIATLGLAIGLPTSMAPGDQAAALFDEPAIHEISLEFVEADWYDVLYDAHGNDDFYLPCTFSWTEADGDVQVLEQVGARFKGNSSFNNSGTRKSMKIDFNEFVDGQEFLALRKLNLNNNWRDPSVMREKLFLDFMQEHAEIHRANFARLTINGEDWGVYTLVEQVDGTFVDKHWGSNDDGNLYKGEYIANFAYQGNNPDEYRDNYEKKSNEEEDDWSDIIALCQFLDMTDDEDMDEELPGLVDLDQHNAILGASALFSSYDSYVGPAHNFYVYHRSADGLWYHVNWDNNMSFGNFRNALPDGADVLTMPLDWTRQGNGPNVVRPFADAVFENTELYREYMRNLAHMLRSGFDVDEFTERINVLDALLHDELATDPYFEFTLEEYEQNLHEDTDIGPFNSIGLSRFVLERGAFVRSELDAAADSHDLRINEVQTFNTTTVMDEAGDYDPWVELGNLGPGTVQLGTTYLSNDPKNPTAWQLPNGSFEDGDLVLLWLDGEPGEGSNHASFSIDAKGGTLYLSDNTGSLIDSIDIPPMNADESWGRRHDGEGEWEITGEPTPGEPNAPAPPPLSSVLVINEFMADNETTIADEAGEYDDWIELLNIGEESIDLSGCTMSDALDQPDEWTFPAGTIIEPGEHLLVWADEDLDQGPLHADFKLSGQGEEVGLWTGTGELIDSIVFGDQSPDVSFGRLPDGGPDWQYLQVPTPADVNIADPAEVPVLFINELMASNTSTIEDPDAPGEFEDWFEIHNPGSMDVDMGGLFMTDDLDDPGAWLVPDGVIVPSGGFIIIWADNDPEQGDQHATFQLTSSGESVAIFALDGVTLIDSVDFPALGEDIAWGRLEDGGATWGEVPPTPGESNGGGTPCTGDLDGDNLVGVNDLLACIAGWGTGNGDANGDGNTNVDDLLLIIAHWGTSCP